MERSEPWPDLLTFWEGTRWRQWSRADWRRRSLELGSGLRALGISSGEPVACLLTNGVESAAAVLGVWAAGGCLVSLPVIARGMAPERYRKLLHRVLDECGARFVLADADVAPIIERLELRVPVVSMATLRGHSPHTFDPPGPAEPAFIQYSSGSTTHPRGCVLTPTAIAWQLAALEDHLAIDPAADRGVVWLPLSHDMGLFGCLLLSHWTGHRCVFGTPERFLRSPSTWMEDCASFGATVSAAPGFALDMATRVIRDGTSRPFPMRRLVVGGDRIDAGTLRRAQEVLGPVGVTADSLMPAYGLAEAVLAVTMTPLGKRPRLLTVDADALATATVRPIEPDEREVGRTKTIVSAGPPLPGVQVTIAGSGVGEIVVDSPSLATGYMGGDSQRNVNFTGSGLRTGDLGFVHEGALYITGRADDLMVLGGRNVYAADIEVALQGLDGIRPGCCAATAVEDGPYTRVVLLLEAHTGSADLSRLTRSIRERTMHATGVSPSSYIFLPRGQLPKTPSGKLQRHRCREIAESPPDGAVRVGS